MVINLEGISLMTEVLLYLEVNIACIMILFLLIMKTKESAFLQAQRFFFILVGISNVALFISDAVWILISSDIVNVPLSINVFVNALYYIFSTLTCYFWFLYAESVQESKLFQNKKILYGSMIPLFIVLILILTSMFTGHMFYVDSDGDYHRGTLYFLQIGVGYAYCIFTTFKALYLSKKTSNYQQKQSLRTLAGFITIPFVAAFIQICIPGIPALCVGTTVGLLNVYISLQEQLVSVDPLTKLNNRNQLRQYMSQRLGKYGGKKPLYLLMMDGNHFKQINDQYGHIEGDNALKEIANALCRACTGKHDFISRFGGDEFIVLTEPENGDSVEALCQRIHYEMTQAKTDYPISVCIGYAKYTNDIKTGQQFIDLADKELYKVKQARN